MDRILVDTELGMIHYLVLVKDLAESYFDETVSREISNDRMPFVKKKGKRYERL